MRVILAKFPALYASSDSSSECDWDKQICSPFGYDGKKIIWFLSRDNASGALKRHSKPKQAG